MITVDGTAQSAISADARGVALLVELEFLGGTVRYTTWPVDIVSGSTYLGFGTLASLSGLSESEDRSARKVELGFTVVNQAMLALLIGAASEYRNRRARIYMQFMDSLYKPAGAAILRWSGFMDGVSVDRRATSTLPGGGVSQGTVKLSLIRAGFAQAKRADGLRTTQQQQAALYPTDRGFEYQQQLLEKPALWLSKKFQEQQ